jgi:hypothetical protein
MIVDRPAVEIGPFDRLELRVGDTQRVDAVRMCRPSSARNPSRGNRDAS